MVETKHTPEPWDSYPQTGVKFVELTLADYRRAARCVNGCKGVAGPETTVPELVAVLERLIKWHDTIGKSDPLTWNEVLVKARAALAKAKGEA